MKRLAVGLAAVAIATCVMGGTVFAGIAVSIDGPGVRNNVNRTDGWEFTPNVNILVDSLGIFDHGTPGLNVNHRVTLWTLAGAELAHVDILESAQSTLPDDNIFVSITPVPLSQGQTYVVSSHLSLPGYPNEYEFFRDLNDGTLIAPPPELSVATGIRRYLIGNGFPVETSTSRPVPLGPNLTFSAVPEPSTLAALLGIGLTGLLGYAWRRRKAAA